jgi:hypothetical protein
MIEGSCSVVTCLPVFLTQTAFPRPGLGKNGITDALVTHFE